MKRATPRQHNYLKKVRAMIAAGVFPRDVGVHQLTIYHDSWCGIYKRQRCNCDPDVRLAWSQPDVSRN